jgi:hypothetical protein
MIESSYCPSYSIRIISDIALIIASADDFGGFFGFTYRVIHHISMPVF